MGDVMKIDINKIKVKDIIKDDVNEYLDLVTIVKANMNNPEWLGNFSKEDCVEIINNNGSIVVFYYEDNVVGAGLLIPSSQKDLEKFLSGDFKLEDVVDFGPQMVHPNYIGNNIQMLIIKKLEEVSIKKGYKYIITTVHPDNIFSIKNILKSGFYEIGNVILKRGPRNVYRKDISNMKKEILWKT